MASINLSVPLRAFCYLFALAHTTFTFSLPSQFLAFTECKDVIQNPPHQQRITLPVYSFSIQELHDEAIALLPLVKVPRPENEIAALSRTHDLTGIHAIENINLSNLRYGRYIFLVIKVESDHDNLRLLVEPEFNLEGFIQTDNQEGSVGSHEGLYHKALNDLKKYEKLSVLVAGEFLIGSPGLILEINDRSRTFPSVPLDLDLKTISDKNKTSLKAQERNRLRLAQHILVYYGLELSPFFKLTTFIEEPYTSVPIRHTRSKDIKFYYPELLSKHLKVKTNRNLWLIEELLLEFYATVLKFTPIQKDKDSVWSSYPYLDWVFRYLDIKTNANPRLDGIMFQAKNSLTFFMDILSHLSKYEPENLILKYNSNPEHFLDQLIHLLRLWQEKGEGLPESPFTDYQLQLWKIFEEKVVQIFDLMQNTNLNPKKRSNESPIPTNPFSLQAKDVISDLSHLKKGTYAFFIVKFTGTNKFINSVKMNLFAVNSSKCSLVELNYYLSRLAEIEQSKLNIFWHGVLEFLDGNNSIVIKLPRSYFDQNGLVPKMNGLRSILQRHNLDKQSVIMVSPLD